MEGSLKVSGFKFRPGYWIPFLVSIGVNYVLLFMVHSCMCWDSISGVHMNFVRGGFNRFS